MTNRFGLEPDRIVGAFVAGLLAELALTVFSNWFPNAGGGYGAPFEVGRSQGLALFQSPERPDTFSAATFALDVAIATLLFFLVARWSGILGIALGVVGALASLPLIIVMDGYHLPIVGLPIPLFRANPLSPSLVMWLDMFFWAGVLAALVRWRRQRTRAAAS